MAGGDVFVENALPEHLKPVVAKLKEAGVTVEEEIDGIRVISSGKGIKAVDIKTLPYPWIPNRYASSIHGSYYDCGRH